MKKSKWISVRDNLPLAGEENKVLTTDMMTRTIAHYIIPSDKRRRPYWNDENGEWVFVTHWTPLLPIPKTND